MLSQPVNGYPLRQGSCYDRTSGDPRCRDGSGLAKETDSLASDYGGGQPLARSPVADSIRLGPPTVPLPTGVATPQQIVFAVEQTAVGI
jgi:hypothetical protein